MPEAVWLQILGLRTKVLVQQTEHADEVRQAWSACAAEPITSPDLVVELEEVRGGAATGHDGTLAVPLERLTQAITVAAIGALAGQRLMLHACAVADEQAARCVVLVGPSGMGKTTMAATLGSRWSYVTDECVVVGPDGFVVPFPKPLSVISGQLAKRQVAPAALGLEAATTRSRPVGLILLQRAPTASELRVDEVSTVQAVALLAEHASFLAKLDHPLGHVARLVHAAGGLKVVTYAESSELLPLVDELMGSQS